MRILELLALFRELFTNELRALLHALPTALDTFRDALLATFDACVGFFSSEDPPPRCKTRPRCLPCVPVETALDTDDAALLLPPPSPGPIAEDGLPVSSFLERPVNAQEIRESLEAAGVDLALVQGQVDRMDSIQDLSLEGQRQALVADVARQLQIHFAVVADDIDDMLRSDPLVPEDQDNSGSDMSISDDDDGASLHSAASTVASADDPEVIESAPPSLVLSDFNEEIPRVPGVARVLPPGWNTDWTVNTYTPIRPASEVASDDIASVVSETPMPMSAGPPFSLSSLDELTTIASQIPLPDSEESEREPEPTDVAKPDEPVAAEIVEETVNQVVEVSEAGSSPPHSRSSSVSSWRSGISTGMSYRQLTLELAPEPEEDDSSSFYRAALQKLRQERELRQRLRAESADEADVEPSTPVMGLSPLRAMRVTPLMPEYEDDESRLARKQKLSELRQRTTSFHIKIGQPLGASLGAEAV